MNKWNLHLHLHLFLLLFPVLLVAETAPTNAGLEISQDDLRIVQQADGGFHLYIKKKPGINSVLLTESTRDPSLKAANYAYRAPEWNAVNGDEIRMLDGKPISKQAKIWSLISSTPEQHSELGQAFHVFIPYILHYGYQTGRHGEVYVTAGTYLNIRAFTLPYADYNGSFKDNPFVLEVALQQPQQGRDEGKYMKEAVDAFSKITSGLLLRSSGPADLADNVKDILTREKGKDMDIVICLDTTGSMKKHIDEIRKKLVSNIEPLLAGSTYRIGMVLYKDYNEEYITKVIPFTDELSQIQKTLDGITVRGGKDIPEAVHEALYDAVDKFSWEADKKLVILVGDAPPHLRPQGKITEAMVINSAEEKGVRINSIILPQ
jgi:Mg-chelatase subunit ChlD